MTLALVALAFSCLVLVAWLLRRLVASEALLARSEERVVALARDITTSP